MVAAAAANRCINLTRALSRPMLAHGPRQPASPAALAGYAHVRLKTNMTKSIEIAIF